MDARYPCGSGFRLTHLRGEMCSVNIEIWLRHNKTAEARDLRGEGYPSGVTGVVKAEVKGAEAHAVHSFRRLNRLAAAVAPSAVANPDISSMPK